MMNKKKLCFKNGTKVEKLNIQGSNDNLKNI